MTTPGGKNHRPTTAEAVSDQHQAIGLHDRHIAILSTGGTIAKTYNESDGSLANQRCVLELLLASLVLHGLAIDRIPVMNKDSLDMTEEDHDQIADAAGECALTHDGVIIVHGTDRLTKTGERIIERVSDTPRVPIVLTGAMRPYELRTTDAVQNMTEALLAVQLIDPGVYCVMHNNVLRFPGVVKDFSTMTFRYVEPAANPQLEGEPPGRVPSA